MNPENQIDRVEFPAAAARHLVSAMSHQDRDRVLENLIWDVFGDVRDDGENVLVPGRTPEGVDVLSLLASLRQELWPDLYPSGDLDGEDESEEDPGENRDDDPVAIFKEDLGAYWSDAHGEWVRIKTERSVYSWKGLAESGLPRGAAGGRVVNLRTGLEVARPAKPEGRSA